MMNNVDIPILYHSKTSVCSQKVRLVLAELDVKWQGFFLDLKKGEQFLPDYLMINPKASVPAYIDGDECLTESNDIIMHLVEEKFKSSHLSINPNKFDDVKSWLEESVRFHTSVHVLTTLSINREKLLSLSPEELAEKLNRFPDRARAKRVHDVVQSGLEGIAASTSIIYLKNIFQKLETQLQRSEFLCGDSVTVADLAILPFVMRIDFLQLKPDWSDTNFNAVDDWIAKLKQRPSFKKAIMDFHSPEALEKYKVHGTPLREELMKL
ncbi:MAG: glutathione S-transferase family protein [Lentilitoribacter sp.]